MVPKSRIKHVKSLQIKKYRKQEQSFIVEGAKSIKELLNSSFQILTVFGTPSFLATCPQQDSAIEWVEVKPQELEAMGQFQSNGDALAVARIPSVSSFSIQKDEFILVLEDIRDPGNLGTIIRAADWYGISKIVASEKTADFFNGKVINASMGSFTRVQFQYADLVRFLRSYSGEIFGMTLAGENIHHISWTQGGLLIIGNEAQGISPEVQALLTQQVMIPRFGHAESLNAAMATAIVLDNVRRS